MNKVFLLIALISLTGCATAPSEQSSTLVNLEYGDDYDQLRKNLELRGYRYFFKDTNGDSYHCNELHVPDTAQDYLLLAKNGRLYSLISRKELVDPAHFGSVKSPPGQLPHEDGFANLVAPFTPPRPLNRIDFLAPDQNRLAQRKHGDQQVAGHMIAMAPLLPVAALSMSADRKAYGDALETLERINLGMSHDAVLKLLGEPGNSKGDPSNYGVLVYYGRPYYALSMGFRGNKLTWFRSNIDALRAF